MSCHAYTHVDVPVISCPADRDITAMPVDQWMGRAAVVDLTHLGENGEVTAEDLERRAGHVEAGDIVLLRTDWPRRTNVETERFWSHAPWTGRGCVRLARGQAREGGGLRLSARLCDPHDDLLPAHARGAPRVHDARRLLPGGITVIEY